ncbi:hypothetical protein VTJ83DRAFT_3388 [Remersonia thermophila]|uniref:Mitochondrial import inner membrane translocase subunit TIM50 n=1 Tax=Remersonia thermophila TaxID=72144 RepID=A0ABR4DE58_9PEZI
MDQNPHWDWQPSPDAYQQRRLQQRQQQPHRPPPPPMPGDQGSYPMPFSGPFHHQGSWAQQVAQPPPPPPPPPYSGANQAPKYHQGWAGRGYDGSGPWGGHQPNQAYHQTNYRQSGFSRQPPTDWTHSHNSHQGSGWGAARPENHIPQQQRLQQAHMRGGQATSHSDNTPVAPGRGSSKRARRKRRLRAAMEQQQALQQQDVADRRQALASRNAASAVGNGPFVAIRPLQQQQQHHHHPSSVAPESSLAPSAATGASEKKKKKKEKKKKQQQQQQEAASNAAATATTTTTTTTPAPTATQAAATVTTTAPTSTPAAPRPPSEPRRDPITAPSAASGGVPSPTRAYLTQSLQPPSTLPAPKTLLVVIDLNGTLLHRPNRRTAPSRFVERPGARQFLARCLARHRVVIWSSARPNNVRLMCAQLFSPQQLRDEVVAVWGRDRFGLSPDDYNRRTQCYKRLSRLWEDPAVASSHPRAREGVTWGQADTVLIDDSAEKARSEPHNAVTLPEFVGDRGEKPLVLPLVEAYLDELAWQKDVSGYIRVHPFAVV